MKVLAAFSLLKPPMRNAAIYIDGSNLVGSLQRRGWPAFIDLDYLAGELVNNDRLVHIFYSFSSPHPDVPRYIEREHKTSGYIIAFSFGKGAYEEAARAKLEKDSLDITLIKVDELDKFFPTSK